MNLINYIHYRQLDSLPVVNLIDGSDGKSSEANWSNEFDFMENRQISLVARTIFADIKQNNCKQLFSCLASLSGNEQTERKEVDLLF